MGITTASTIDAPHRTLNDTRGHNVSHSAAAMITATISATTRLMVYAPIQKSLDSPRSNTCPQLGQACFILKYESQMPPDPQRGQRRWSARAVRVAKLAGGLMRCSINKCVDNRTGLVYYFAASTSPCLC